MPKTTETPQQPTKHPIPDNRAQTHIQWLKELTAIPTAAGHEYRVIAWITNWINERPDLNSKTDAHGNIEIRIDNNPKTDNPIYFTAHLDHPAFVVDEVLSKAEVTLEFRGGVMDDYFPNAKIRIHTPTDDQPNDYTLATISEEIKPDPEADPKPSNKRYHAILENPRPIDRGSLATWDLPEQEIIVGEEGNQILYTNACDDLAAAAAALAAFDELRHAHSTNDTRILFTRAEEVGFIGAIGASRDYFMPKASRIIALENSRAFDDSPIHAGPIVRVGDRISIFSPDLTGAVAKVAEQISGGAATPKASQKESDMPKWKWQRKLMAGGACEASVFCAYGYTATCVCLPLGNYHNMANLTDAQAGNHEQAHGSPPRVGREHIGIDDYQGMIDLLIACGTDLPKTPSFTQRIEKLWNEKSSILTEP